MKRFKDISTFCSALLLAVIVSTGATKLSAQVIINETTLTSGTYTVPYSGQITITLRGGDGGNGSNTAGGEGAAVTATFAVNAGDVIRYVVGEAGNTHNGSSAGGGGSSGVYINNALVLVAGGGGGGDNSNGAVGLGANTGTAGDDGTGGGPGAAGTNGNGGGATTTTAAAGGGGGFNSAGGSGDAGGGARSDATTAVLTELLAIADGGAGNGTGSAGGRGFSGGGGADSNYSGGGGGYSGGGGAGSNGSAGGGGSYIAPSALSSSSTPGGDGAGSEADGSILVNYAPDTDGDGILDSADPDDDNDGILDTVEGSIDTDGDTVINSLDLDSDNDGISDILESGADVASLDPDNNGIIDGPQFTDGDSDGLSDAIESENGADTGTSPLNSDGFGQPDFLDLDTDNDGIPDNVESQTTSAYSAPAFTNNASNRGVNDNGLFIPVDSDGDGVTDVKDENSDGDSLTDTQEGGSSVSGVSYTDPNGSINDPSSDLPNQHGTSAEVAYRENRLVWSIGGPASADEGTTATYTINLSGQLGLNQSVSVQPFIADVTTTSADYTSLNDSVAAAVASYEPNAGQLSWDGSTLTFTADDADATVMPPLNINIGLVGDTESESDEEYTVGLSNPAGTSVASSVVSGGSGSVTTTIQNVIPDLTAPVLSSTSVSGNQLVLDYDETLDAGSNPATGDYVLRINAVQATVNAVTISGDKVFISFNPAVAPGDNVELDYAPGSNPVQDASGNAAASFSSQPVNNPAAYNSGFGPDPCPIANGQDAAWACFDGATGGTSMTAEVGGLVIATVSAASGSQTTFAPNALQSWASGAFSGDQFNGPQANPGGSSANATSLDIVIPDNVPSDAIILSFNRLRPDGGNTSYTLEAFDASNAKVPLNGWITGQGTDGGVCTNNINLSYTNGGTTIEFQPTVSGLQACASSSTPIWFRITDDNVKRIELRKVTSQPDNIYLGLALVADFGDAPNSYNTSYSSRTAPPAFHLLNNLAPNTVYLGSAVDGDGNGSPGGSSTGDDSESGGIGSGDDEDGTTGLTEINTDETTYSTTLSCTDGGYVGGWIDFDQSGTFDLNEFDSGVCASGSVTLNWFNISGLVTGTSHARFRIASNADEVANPGGYAKDGEVEDYSIQITDPPTPDLAIDKIVDSPTPIEGDTVVFTVSVTNPGNFEATGIQVTDVLPAGLTYLSSVASQGTYVNGTGIWNIGSLPEGASTTVTLSISAIVNNGTLGTTITNEAEITSLNESDPDLSNNSASSGITVVPEASDIALTKSVDEDQPIEGETIIFTITATNNGPKNATGVTIIDQVPTGLNFLSATTTTGTYNNSTGIWDIGNLANGAADTLVITVSVDGGTEGSQIINAADLNTIDQNDPVAANNTASVTVDVITPGVPANCSEIPNLVFQNATLISGTAGQVGAIYEFQNITSGVDAEVEILTVNNASLVAIDQNASGLDTNFQPQIEAVDKTLPEGFIDFEVRFKDAISGNPRYLTMTASGVDVDGDNQDTREFVGFQRLTSFTVESTTNLSVGSEGIFTTFESATSAVVNGIDPNDTDNLAYTTYTNEPQFRIRAGIKDPTDGATGGAAQRLFAFSFDACIINNFNNPVSSDIVDISVIKTVDFVTPNVGDTVTYTLDIANEQGNAVSNIELTDQLPSGLTFVSASTTQGSYNSTSGIWDIGGLNGNDTAQMILKATVDAGQEGNTISNTATFTNYSGTDGNISNNSATVDIVVFDPGSGLSCNEPPLFSFNNHTLDQGSPLQVNAVYRFSNVSSGVDALVRIVAINNATLDNVDDNGIANSPANFSPLFTALSGGGYIDWEITFVQTGTNTPIKRNFALTGLDIDGFDQGGGQTIRDYLGFSQNQANAVETGTNLGISSAGPFQLFESSVATDGNGTFDTDHMAYITYFYTSVLQIRTGSFTTGGYSDDRLVDIDFTQCRIQDFNNPVTTTRNADIQVVKTADEANPLENETVNFTITVTNNGPENATELDINESLPAGLTLVQATPSQGVYNQLTKLWTVGTLNSGTSATLELETTVNSGITQDSLVNTAYVNGFNQFDPNTANDSSTVTLEVSVQVDGVVFLDKTGNGITDGDANFGDATGDQQAVENVEVHLFKDGGDGLADGNDDHYISTDLTDNKGFYSFQIGDEDTYWIVVDSKTGGLSSGTTWAEQTYAPVGALCTDGTGGTDTTSVAGNCFGGRRGGVSDNISSTPVASDLANAEHIARFSVSGSGITDLDFGFSFNVVTDIRDGDDDTGASRSIQGSLRQFITNANSRTGANGMRFVPAVSANETSGGANWWSITLTSELPAITDALTTIDGTAFSLTAPLTEVDSNPGFTGSGGSVGLDAQGLNSFALKELELNLADAGQNALLLNSSGSVVIRDIAVYNGVGGINVASVSSGTISDNLIGLRADGTDPGGNLRNSTGIVLTGSGSVSALIQQNYIAYASGDGISSDNAGAVLTVHKNEVAQNGLGSSDGNGIEFTGTWTITQNLIRDNGSAGSSPVNGGNGIQVGRTSGLNTGSTIRNNTIIDNKVTGINVFNNVTNTLIEKNIINGNGTNYSASPTKLGAGVKLTFPDVQPQQGVKITNNSFANNYGLAIDIVTSGSGEADGVLVNDGTLESGSTEPNRGLDYPVFTLATIDNGVLHVEGYIGTFSGKLNSTYTIEVYKALNDGDSNALIEEGGALSSPHGEGNKLIGTITTNPDGTFSQDITIPGTVSLVLNDRITGLTIGAANNTSEFGANHRIVPTGVTINGTVYHDTNFNSVFENGESGIQGVTIVLYNVAENNCRSVITNSNGQYEFTNVLNGEYQVIEAHGEAVPTPNVCVPAAADPADHVSTNPNVRTVTINNLPSTQNFGDFEGTKIQGRIFTDNGIGGGIANDALQNGGETPISAATVAAYNASEVLIRQTVTNGAGDYTLYLPKSSMPTGSVVKVRQTNKVGYMSTGAKVGSTSGSYDINTDQITFTTTVGTTYTGLTFSDVETSTLLNDGQRLIAAGSSTLLTHVFQAKTGGEVTFTTNTVNDPNNISWPVLLYQDLNCNNEIDSGEQIINGSTFTVTANEFMCLILKVTAPTGLPDQSTSTTTVTASFELTNSSPLVTQTLTRTDLVTIDNQQGGFSITKTVDKNQALPGSVLTYTINYINNGTEPISNIKITDTVPNYTTFSTASFSTPLPDNLTNCTITAPSVGGTGQIKWEFTGTLLPGQSGTVNFTVTINQ